MTRAALAFALAPLALLVACASEPPPNPETPKAAPAEPQLDEPKEGDGSGFLDVICNPPTKVLIDGKDAGQSPLNQHKVAPGSHDVTCVDDEHGNATQSVNVGPNESKGLTLNATPHIQESATPDKPAKGGGGKKK